MTQVLFVRIGWMRWYRGPQADDEKPIGGGAYNKRALGHEAFNFLPLDGHMLAFFEHRADIALERIQAGFAGKELEGVLTIFVATDQKRGGQRIVGWFREATVYRRYRESRDKRRSSFSYALKTLSTSKNAVLIPESKRDFIVPGGKGGFGQANVCYVLDANGHVKNRAKWIDDAVKYVRNRPVEAVLTSAHVRVWRASE